MNFHFFQSMRKNAGSKDRRWREVQRYQGLHESLSFLRSSHVSTTVLHLFSGNSSICGMREIHPSMRYNYRDIPVGGYPYRTNFDPCQGVSSVDFPSGYFRVYNDTKRLVNTYEHFSRLCNHFWLHFPSDTTWVWTRIARLMSALVVKFKVHTTTPTHCIDVFCTITLCVIVVGFGLKSGFVSTEWCILQQWWIFWPVRKFWKFGKAYFCLVFRDVLRLKINPM